MKIKVIAFCLFFCCFSIYAEIQYFDVLFGINSIETKETLEGIETKTTFTLNAEVNIINIIKIERANGTKEFYLYCSERNNNYRSVRVRISFDGVIKEFIENSPGFSANYNNASWGLFDNTINQFINCNEIAIEFGGKVYRYNENNLVIDSFGHLSTFENPITRIKHFLQ
jgi:hypothetical protein